MSEAAPSLNPLAALDPQRSAAVTASAGSGKTWLLTSRILRLLLAGAPPGRILALTFTRKAAAEMRSRVSDRLRTLAGPQAARELASIGLSASAENLARARGLYEAQLFDPYPLRAMTLHAFCQDLLGRFALDAGVTPGFTLAQNEYAQYRRAWRRLLVDLHQRPQSPAALALHELIGLGLGEYGLEQLVFGLMARRADWWAFAEERASALDDAAAGLREAQEQRLDTSEAIPHGGIEGEALAARLNMFWRWLDRVDGVGRIKAAHIEGALNAEAGARYEILLACLFRQDGERLKFEIAKSKRKHLSESEIEHFERVHAEVAAAVEHERAVRANRACALRTAAALQLGTAALDALDAELAQQRALSFADLEWRAYRLLRGADNAEWVRYKLDQKIDHLLIDEFQDTSPTQWQLLLPLVEEMAAGDSGRERSLFIVGDAKQSIYGFRRANPALLGTAAAWMHGRMDAVTVPLNKSWRSAPAVIDFVNALFEPPELGQAIGFGRHDTHCTSDWGRIEIAPLVEPEPTAEPALAEEQLLRDPLTTPREIEEATRALLEGRQVARRIKALIDSAVAVREEGGMRAIGYGDVMVLARTRTHLHWLEQALTEEGIPYVGSSRGTLLETAEARDLVALLRFLNSPHRNLELAQTLRSPLFSADDAHLVSLAAAAGTGRTWFDALGGIAGTDAVLSRAHGLLSAWLPLAAQLPAHDLLDRILTQGDAAARYEAALPGVPAARVRANLGAFIQLALEADSGRYPTLARFLDYVEDLRRSGGDAPDEAPAQSVHDQVQVLTIHASKGLESPAVFLINAGCIAQPRTPPWLIAWPPDAHRPTLVVAPAPAGERDAVSEDLLSQQRQQEQREELNLLYVAVTRARQFLHISGFKPARSDRRASWHEHAVAAMPRLQGGGGAPLAGMVEDTLHHGSGLAAIGESPEKSAVVAIEPEQLRKPLRRLQAPGQAAAPSRIDHGETIDAVAARRGDGIHRLLQLLCEEPALSASTLHARLQSHLAGAVTDAEFEQWQAVAQGVIDAPALAAFFQPSRYSQAWNEVPVPHEGTEAFVDRLVDDGRVLWVLDYKTSKNPQPAQLAERYRSQLVAYMESVRSIWPDREVRGGLVLTETRSWVEIAGELA